MPTITVQEVKVDTVTKGRNSYQVANVVYTTERGDNKEKKVMSFSNPAVFAAVRDAKSGQRFDIVSGEAPYYNWASAKPIEEGSGSPAKAPTAASGGKVLGSTYETAEERKIKQLYIIRQSSISNAIEYFKMLQANSDEPVITRVETLLATAQEFVDFVYGTQENLASPDSDNKAVSEA